MISKTQVSIGGREYFKYSSDNGVKIENDGKRYDDALVPVGADRDFTETDEPITPEEVTGEDKDAALRRFGVEV